MIYNNFLWKRKHCRSCSLVKKESNNDNRDTMHLLYEVENMNFAHTYLLYNDETLLIYLFEICLKTLKMF